MTRRLVPDAAAAEPTFVPDGAPCPKHGLPTRLLQMPHIGLYSQCQGCIDAFLDWFAAHTRDVKPAKIFPEYSAIPVEKQHQPAATPAQLDLGVSL